MEALMLSEEHPLRFAKGQVIFKAGEQGTTMSAAAACIQGRSYAA
jgi:hypothetical protein